MVQFHIQPDSEIPASTQLFNQIRFAIASRQFPPGKRLPSTRQLAMQTGLHRNTISKVYRQLEESGFVAAVPGSGIYVRELGQSENTTAPSPFLQEYPQARKLIQKSLDELLKEGFSLNQIRELFFAEIDWRLRSSAQVLVTTPAQDLGAGELMVRELEEALQIPVQLVPLEQLAQVLSQTRSGTVVTSRYFVTEAEAIAAPKSIRVIPIDIYDYATELERLKTLPAESGLGLISLSSGLLRGAEVIIHSLRGDDLLVMTAQANDTYKVGAIVRSAQTIFAFDQTSYDIVKTTIAQAREDLIRPPEVLTTATYIGGDSVSLLKRELGLD